jgi:hypothetical protein
MRKIYARLLTLSLAMMVFAADGYSQASILFVGRDNLGDWQSDQDIYDSLTAWGYWPEFWDSNTDYTTGVGLDYGNYDGMVVNETVDSKVMGKHAEDGYPLPCVIMEGYAVATGSDRWAWIDDNATELYQTPDASGTADDQVLLIKDNSHYITQEFQVGDEVIWSSADLAADIAEIRPVSVKEVNVTYDLKLATMKSHDSQAGFWNMVTVNDIAGNGNRTVFWGINANGLNGSENTATAAAGSFGTPEFYNLLKRSVEWILGAGVGTGVEVSRTNAFELVAFPNPATERVTVRFRANSTAFATATLYNMAGQTVDVFTRATVEGNNYLFLEAGNYPAGIYHLNLDVNGERAVTKVVIQ